MKSLSHMVFSSALISLNDGKITDDGLKYHFVKEIGQIWYFPVWLTRLIIGLDNGLRQTGYRPLSKPFMTRFNGVYMRHYLVRELIFRLKAIAWTIAELWSIKPTGWFLWWKCTLKIVCEMLAILFSSQCVNGKCNHATKTRRPFEVL